MRVGKRIDSIGGNHVNTIIHRMDRDDLESGDGLQQGERWLQALLRRTDGSPTPGDETAQLSEWVWSDPSSTLGGRSFDLEKASESLRELNERPFP